MSTERREVKDFGPITCYDPYDPCHTKVQLLLVPGASLASICVELARLLVPNAQDSPFFSTQN